MKPREMLVTGLAALVALFTALPLLWMINLCLVGCGQIFPWWKPEIVIITDRSIS